MNHHEVVGFIHDSGTRDKNDVVVLLKVGMLASPAAHLIDENRCIFKVVGREWFDSP